MKHILTLLVVLASFIFCHADNIYYYRLTKITKNGNTTTSGVHGGQFVRFLGDICFECDKSGIGIGNGTLKKTSANSDVIIYKGGSYLGYTSYFRFSPDLRELKAHNADASIIYTYVRDVAPTSQTTCTYIKREPTNSNQNSGTAPYIPAPAPATPSQSTQKTRHQCRVCHGSGEKIKEYYSGGRFKWCSKCGAEVNAGHTHQICDYCHGNGYVEY